MDDFEKALTDKSKTMRLGKRFIFEAGAEWAREWCNARSKCSDLRAENQRLRETLENTIVWCEESGFTMEDLEGVQQVLKQMEERNV